MPNLFKSRTFRILAVLAVLIALYAVAGFVVAPRLARNAIVENIQKQLGLTPAVGENHINPFLFQVELKDFSLPDAAGAKMVGFERLFVDFGISTLWRRALVFKAIAIDGPFAHAVVAPDGAVNLMRLAPKPQPSPSPPPKTGPLPAIQVGDFAVSRGLVTYDDLSRPTHFNTRLEPINFDLRDFSTSGEDGRFTFSGASKLGERIEWHGSIGVQPVQSDGELRITGLRARTLWEYLEDQLGFVVDSGTIDIAAGYRFALKDAVDLKVDVSKVALADLGISPRGAGAEQWITVPSLTVEGATLDLAQRQARVESVAVSGVKLTTWMEADKSFNLARLAVPPHALPAPQSPAPVALPEPPAPALPGAQPWRFDLHEFSFQAAAISAEDRGMKPAAKLLLAPFSLKVTDASLDLTKPVGLTLDTGINGSGSLHVDGQVTPRPMGANLAVKLAALDLKAIQPYLAEYTSMTLLGGRLGGDARVRYGQAKPAILLTGNVRVDKLHTVDNALRDDFISWDRLDVLGIKFSQGPNRLDIDQVVASKPYARVIVEADASLNVKRVLTAPGAASTASAAPHKPPDAQPAPPAHEPPAAAANAAPAMPVAIHKIVVRGGKANFSDLSVKPNFSAGIQELQGSVLGLSSKSGSRAKIDLHGQVDPFAPVAITGELNPLSAVLYTDVALSFKNMELTMFNPYSGKFAGYNITKGKLTTEFHYKVEGRKLDAQHHVIVDQLEFGAKTESKDAVSLPVKLAVSLLKDRNGVIDLELPVTGSLDDPQFRLGPLIWKVLLNLLVKAVTAPFALLGSLFGGGPDLQFIDFAPGAATLDAASADKLKAVAKMLAERPQLKIEVPIAPIPELDRAALVAQKFDAEVQGTMASGAAKNGRGAAPAFGQLDPDARVEVLTAVYKKVLGSAPTAKTKDESAADRATFLESALRDRLVVEDGELKALAEQRATQVQQGLLTGTDIDPARVFLVVNDKAKAQDGHARLELVLQ